MILHHNSQYQDDANLHFEVDTCCSRVQKEKLVRLLTRQADRLHVIGSVCLLVGFWLAELQCWLTNRRLICCI